MKEVRQRGTREGREGQERKKKKRKEKRKDVVHCTRGIERECTVGGRAVHARGGNQLTCGTCEIGSVPI